MTQWFNNLPPRKRNVYSVLLGIILLTIPCYCLGIAALAAAPPVNVPPTPTPFGSSATAAPDDELPSLLPDTATPTETSAQTTNTPTATLEPTPTQLFPTVPPTNTPVPPTPTPSPTNTVLPTNTPTGTTVPTITPTPTPTVDATATAAAIATATATANRPPEANDDQASTTQGSSIVIGVLANDVDPNGNLDRTTVTIISAPANGNATVGNEGQITFTPNANFVGTSAFTYQVCDTIGACDTATVTVTVTASNRPPVAENDSASTAEGEAVTINVVANDSDPDGNLDPATVSVVSDPANGTASVAGGGQISYTPDDGFNGDDSFTYEVCDSEDACDTATVAITVTATNEPPNAEDDSASTAVDTPITIDVLDNDSDPDDNLDPATVAIDGSPGNGTVEVGGNGQITYTPDGGFEGDDTFAYEVCDTEGACDTATVTVTVNP